MKCANLEAECINHQILWYEPEIDLELERQNVTVFYGQ